MQQIIGRKRVYSSPWINLEKVDLRLPSGKIIEHNLIDTKNHSVGAVVFKDNKFALIRNFRFATNELSWEIPGGWMKDGERALEAVQKKVEQETGYSVENIEILGEGKPWMGISNKEHFYFMIDLGRKINMHDSDFVKEVRFFNFNKIESMVKRGHITDQSTLTGLFLAKLHKNL